VSFTATTTRELADAIADEHELAIVDARDHEAYSQGHLLWAASIRPVDVHHAAPILLPRRATRVVVTDNGGGEAEDLRDVLASNGWTEASVLAGGIDSWAEEGHELYSGVNVPSKLFGELVERHYRTPHVSALELHQWINQERPLTILDSRTEREFQRMSIPTGRSCPGGELVHRAFDLADQDATIVVNCAGRTRSILGAESLVRAGVPGQVIALENGTMGWELADLILDHGKTATASAPTSTGRGQASVAGTKVAERFNVEQISRSTMDSWGADQTRTLHLFDVRTPDEYQQGHLLDFRNAPGGQLVQATDEYAITRGARLVLADDDLTRATMTASWLLEMGWETYVLDEGVSQGPFEYGNTELPLNSPQVVLPYDPGDAHIARQAMQEYLDWEIALVDQYDRDDLAQFTSDGWA
jgi:rhodanese-related sulfurtransferase